MTIYLDQITAAAPVDEDTDGSMLDAAMEEHSDNANIYPLAVSHPYRDSLVDEMGLPLHREWSPSNYIHEINESGVAIYHLGGWFDMYPLDTLLWFKNLTVPQKVIILPWSHNGSEGFDLIAEHLRWFDYWLKGIDNGIMDEPPITYYVMDAPKDEAWRTTSEWPLPNQEPTRFYFLPGPSGSVESVNDGMLGLDPPTDPTGKDDYTVDYTTTSGKPSRWTDGYGGGFGYPDMTPNDEKSLTYTTEPLEADTEITGHPVVHLWVTATTPDVDFFAYLEEIDEDGESHYITEGVLRASHRALGEAPYEVMGLPYHPSMEADVMPLPDGEPVELIFDMQPTSNVFDSEHRIRITITGADWLNYEAKRQNPAPEITLYLSPDHGSHIVLPVIPAE
jgi:putative CocE/NonD family hydrolase